jgi:hypothetical protein
MTATDLYGEAIHRPPHWTRKQWAELQRLATPDQLCHAMWMVMDDAERVLGNHHDDEIPAWRTMVAGDWPRGWDRRAEDAAHIAWSQHRARRHPERAVSILHGVPEFPAHWDRGAWESLTANIDTALCFDALWLLTNPTAALPDLRGRGGLVVPASSPNDGPCWLSGTAGTSLDEVHDKIVRFAVSRGEAGITRAHIPFALGADPTSLHKDTINRYLRHLVGTGRLRRIPGAAPGRGGADLYVASVHGE